MAITRQILGKVVITNKGEWNSSNVYEVLDVVSYRGSSYISKVYDNDSLPIDDTKWQLLAQKGDTYEVSETDIENIAKQITENANSNFNKNVAEKTETFNSNAETKTTEFNENASTTVDSYNTNAEKKLKEYNENDTTKLKKYNSNANTKLNEYNANSDTKLKEYNDNASQKINEYDSHSKELNDKADSTRKELDRVKNEILDQGETNGSYIHIEDSAMAELQELSIDGVLKQETTKGYNLVNLKTSQSDSYTYSDGIYTTKELKKNYEGIEIKHDNLPLSANDIVYYSAYIRLKSGTSVNMNAIETLSDKKTRVVVSSPKLTSEFQKVIFKLTATEDITYNASMYFQVGTITDTVILEIKNAMITKEDPSNLLYEKFTGGKASPNIDFEQPIKVLTGSKKLTSCNKNLFNKYNSFNYGNGRENRITILDDGTIQTIANYSQFRSKGQLLYLDKNTMYTISGNLLKADGTGVENNAILEIIGEKNGKIKIIDRCLFDTNTPKPIGFEKNFNTKDYDNVSVHFSSWDIDSSKTPISIFDNIQIEKSAQKTLYVEHQESSLTFDIPEGEFVGRIDDTYKDELAVVYNETDGQFHKILKKKVGRIIITNDNIDTLNAWLDNSKSVPALVIAKKQLGLEANRKLKRALTNRYTEISTYNDVRSDTFALNFQIANVWFLDERFTDLDTAKQLIIGTEVYVVLAEPYEVDLGICNIPITFNKISNLFVDNELLPEINIKYYRNFKDTIKNLQENKQDNLVAGEDIVISGNTIDVSQNLKQRTIETRNELERVKNITLNTGEANGSFIHLEDSAMAELQELSIDGVLKQETTKGINLYNVNDRYVANSKFTIDDEGWITLTYDNSDNDNVAYFNFYTNKSSLLKPNTQYNVVLEMKSASSKLNTINSYINICGSEATTQWKNNNHINFVNNSGKVIIQKMNTKEEFDDSVTLMNRDFIQVAVKDSISITYRISVIEDLNVTSDTFVYEKFSGGQPSPSPDYKQPIKILANNLKVVSFNENLVNLFAEVLHNVSYNLTTGINLKEQKSNVNGSHIVSKNRLTINVPQAWGYYVDYIIPVKPNTKYYVSVDNISTNGLKFSDYVLDEEFNIIGVWYISQNNIPNHSITTSAKAKYICLGFSSGVANSTIILENLQLKEESSAEFKEHQESSLTFDIPEGEFVGRIDDTYKDELSVAYNEEDGQFHKFLKKKVGKYKFTGEENWRIGSTTDNYVEFSGNLPNLKASHYLITKSNGFLYEDNNRIAISSTGISYVRIPITSDKTTLEKFKLFISKIEVYYILAEHYEIDLGICDMPFSYDEVTNIFTDSELNPAINTKYYRNFTKTIQNLQVNEKQLKQELIEINSRLSALEAANSDAVSSSIQSEESEVSE